MIHPGHPPKKPTATTGLFALLCALLGVGGTRASKIGQGTGASFLLVLIILSFSVAPALAENGHGYAGLSFGAEGSAAGQLKEPSGVAVNDTTHDVYVADRGNNRIDEFEADGTFVRAWGFDVNGVPGFGECTTLSGNCQAGAAGTGAGQLDSPEAIAVDNDATSASKGDVYVTNTAENDTVIEKFSATGKYEGQLTGVCEKAGESPPSCAGFIPFKTLNGVAIDPTGNVWVYWTSGGNGEIAEFSDTGSFIKNFNPNRGPNVGLAVDSSDNVYFVPGNGGVSKWDPETATVIEEEFSSNVSGLAIDPAGNDLYVDQRGSIARYGPFGEPYATPEEEFGSGQLTDGGGSGLAVDSSSGTVYVADSTSDLVDAFAEGEKPKAPLTEAAEKVTGMTATLKGELQPPTTELKYYFEYNVGTSCAGGKKAPEPDEEGKGKVSQEVTGLEPLVQYTVCLVAENTFGRTVGAPVTFNTLPAPPTIESESTSPFPPNEGDPHPRPASEIRLEASVNANNEPTECHFQYQAEEPSLSAPTTTLCEPNALAGTFGPQSVALNVGGLEAGKVYYYRVVAKNAAGETQGIETEPPKQFETALPPNTPEKAEATGITKTTATLNGILNPTGARANQPGSDEFVYRQSATECQIPIKETVKNPFNHEPEEIERKENEHTAATTAAPGLLEKEAAKSPVTELLPGAPYTFCLIVRNEAGEETIGAPETFTTQLAVPSITAESASGVTATEATLNAQIDPNGAATSYYFEYGATTSYSEPPTPLTKLNGSLIASDTATATLRGLQPNTTYHYRVVATNSQSPGGIPGEDETFITSPAQTTSSTECPNEKLRVEQPYGQTLPDCRAYEMVSPVETGGNDATDSEALTRPGRVRASEDTAKEGKGEEATPAITYVSHGSFAGPDGATFESQLLSRRNVQEGRWETRSITAPSEHPASGPAPAGYIGVFFTPGLTEGLTSTAAAGLSPEAPEGLKELYRVGLTDGPGPYQLVSDLPGTKEEKEYAQPYEVEYNVYPLGASSDLSHVVFATEEVGPGPLREWVNGRVVFVGVSNESQLPWASATVGWAGEEGDGEPARLLQGGVDVWRAVSEDGSRVIVGHSGELYARVNADQSQSAMKDLGLPDEECLEPAKACTVKLSTGGARYWGANPEDTKIFYTDTENGDLYEYELPIGAVKGEARPLTTSGGEVQGVSQISEDGSYVYFVANGVLAANVGANGTHATPGNCITPDSSHYPVTGTACNLYVSHDGGEPVFIATLSFRDGSDWQSGPGGDTAALEPGPTGGAHLAFASRESLAGYDNQRAQTGKCEGRTAGGKCPEVYLYDAETGALVCASCNPSGARPVGPASLATGAYGIEGGASDYRPRDLLANGSLFFDSSDALVPHASDGRQNVYEYEDGHVYPISNVAGGQESFFLDASADGQDVFFGSADQLLPEDTGDNVAVWDAREDGGFPVNVSAPPCTTAEACRAASPPTPGVFGAPPSATFSGPGNASSTPPAVVKPKPKTAAQLKAEKLVKALKTCRTKKNKQKRQACEKRARAKYGPTKSKTKKAKKATTNRRTH
jgi:hypothetical protein